MAGMDAGLAEDAYAEPTNRYGDLQGALTCFLADCGFVVPDDPSTPVQETILDRLFPDEA